MQEQDSTGYLRHLRHISLIKHASSPCLFVQAEIGFFSSFTEVTKCVPKTSIKWEESGSLNKKSNSCIFEGIEFTNAAVFIFMSSISIECQTTCIIKQSHFFLAAPRLKTFVSLKRHDSFKTKLNHHEPCFQTISATPRQCPSNRSRLVICHV